MCTHQFSLIEYCGLFSLKKTCKEPGGGIYGHPRTSHGGICEDGVSHQDLTSIRAHTWLFSLNKFVINFL